MTEPEPDDERIRPTAPRPATPSSLDETVPFDHVRATDPPPATDPPLPEEPSAPPAPDDSRNTDTVSPPPASEGQTSRGVPAASRVRQSARLRARGRIAPVNMRRMADPRIWIAAIGSLLVLLALLASEPGLALLAAATLAPLIAIVTLDRMDVFDREPAMVLLGVAAAGVIAGVFIALLNGFLLDEFWEDDPIERIGAVGLAGELAGRGDSPPLAVYALAGVLLPALAIAVTLAAPIACRRWQTFRNEAMDGVTLGAAAGGGFALGTAAVYLWPLVRGDAVAGSVADWTASTLAIVLLRPVILMGVAGLVGLAIWQFDLSRRTQDLMVPFAGGLGGAIAYALFGLVAEQSGPAVLLLWNVAIVVALLVAGRALLTGAISFDRRLLTSNRIVCPQCRRVTPAGKFCAFCQNPLPADTSA